MGLVGWWAFARLAGFDGHMELETVRGGLAVFGTVAVIFGGTVGPHKVGGMPIRPPTPRGREIAGAFAMGTLALAWISLGLSSLAVAVAVILLAFARPVARRAGIHRIETVLFSDLVNRVSINASERERARIASDLHDVPLQQLTGVIRRLDLLPEARVASDQLRAVAHDLRAVAANQRPPVLDDLGLAAALEFAAGQLSTSEVPVRLRIVDRTGMQAVDRPPPNLELAIFRIVQEAVTNALRHARASEVVINADLAPDRVDVAIIDDGVGLMPDLERMAARRGRQGLASMRRRARAVGAELSIAGSKDGTTIRTRWQA